jgi:RHS repeat-associated protein
VFRRVFYFLALCIAACALLLSGTAHAGYGINTEGLRAKFDVTPFSLSAEKRIKGAGVQSADCTYHDVLAKPRLSLGKAPVVTAGAVGPCKLVYFGKRYLVPSTGRWLNPDPLGLHVPGRADANLYAYVHGRVFTSVDPLGLDDDDKDAGAPRMPIAGVPSPTNPHEPDPSHIKNETPIAREVTKAVVDMTINAVPGGLAAKGLSLVVRGASTLPGRTLIGGIAGVVSGGFGRWRAGAEVMDGGAAALDFTIGAAAGAGAHLGVKVGATPAVEYGPPPPKANPAPSAAGAAKQAAASPNGAVGEGDVQMVNPRELVSRQGPSEMTGSKIKRLAKDMATKGFNPAEPVEVSTVDGKKIIVQGHHRTEAAKKAKLDRIPAKEVAATPEEKAQYSQQAEQAAAERDRRRE